MVAGAAGYDPAVIAYLETGWTRPQLLALFAACGLSPRQALREQRSPARDLGLLEPGVTDATILEAMLVLALLVNRPIVATPRGVRLCRPSEVVLDLLDRWPPGPLAKEDGSLVLDRDGKRVSRP